MSVPSRYKYAQKDQTKRNAHGVRSWRHSPEGIPTRKNDAFQDNHSPECRALEDISRDRMCFNNTWEPQSETRCYHITNPKKEDSDEPQLRVIEITGVE